MLLEQSIHRNIRPQPGSYDKLACSFCTHVPTMGVYVLCNDSFNKTYFIDIWFFLLFFNKTKLTYRFLNLSYH